MTIKHETIQALIFTIVNEPENTLARQTLHQAMLDANFYLAAYGIPLEMKQALDQKPKLNIPFSRRVFIGEYGYQANAGKPETLQKQYEETKEIMKIAFELKLPFALHWQMYNNEYENGVSKQMSLINENGVKTKPYFLHQNFYKAMNTYLKEEFQKNNQYPSADQYSTKAIQVLGTL